MTIRPPAPCAAGHLTLYRLYDVGYVIDLARAFERLSPNSPERARPARLSSRLMIGSTGQNRRLQACGRKERMKDEG